MAMLDYEVMSRANIDHFKNEILLQRVIKKIIVLHNFKIFQPHWEQGPQPETPLSTMTVIPF